MKVLIGLFDDPPVPGSPLADFDEYLLWLGAKRAEAYDVDRQIAAVELERAFTVWMMDPSKDAGEDYDALMARLKAEVAAKLAALSVRPLGREIQPDGQEAG